MSAVVHELLGRHSKYSRVTWHPGSTPPYSSLWIVVQRFLILNQPTRSAFAQDFLFHNNGGFRISLDADKSGKIRCPVRIQRFVRALKEPQENFRHCYLGQLPKTTWKYFGPFVTCPACLREGFHSILYSFNGMQVCPVHGVKLTLPGIYDPIVNSIEFNELYYPHFQSGCGPMLMEYSTARFPNKNPERDRLLGEIAQWLSQTGSQYWVGKHAANNDQPPPDARGDDIVRLKIALDLPGAEPTWFISDERLRLDPSSMMAVRFGSTKVRGTTSNIQELGWSTEKPGNPYAYYKTLLQDFKSINRYVRHHILRGARYWIGRFANASHTGEIEAMLSTGGSDVLRAWDVLIWWQSCLENFNLNSWFKSRPFRMIRMGQTPSFGNARNPGKRFLEESDNSQEWIVRWVNAMSLVALWQATRVIASHETAPVFAISGKGSASLRTEPDWGLAITPDRELLLFIDRAREDFWMRAPHIDKAQHKARNDALTRDRDARVRAACAELCVWYHADTYEWITDPGPVPEQSHSCKKHRLLPASLHLWFAVFPSTGMQRPDRAFSARCLGLPVATTGATAKSAIKNLKYAVGKYMRLE